MKIATNFGRLALALLFTAGGMALTTATPARAQDTKTVERKAGDTKPLAGDTEWYFVEGNTMVAGGLNFTTYLLIQNAPDAAPTLAATDVTVTYYIQGASTIEKEYDVNPDSKLSINTVNDVGLNKSFSMKVASSEPVIAERSMYWSANGERWADGQSVPGLTYTWDEWYLPEGNTTAGGLNFTTYVMIQNPNDTAANIDVTYNMQGGAKIMKEYTVGANTKFSINAVNDVGANKSFSVMITSDQDIAVERSMYWDSNGIKWAGGDGTTAIDYEDTDWYIADGKSVQNTSNDYTTFIIVQNPNDVDLDFVVTYFFESGEPVEKTHSVEAEQKYSINVKNDLGDSMKNFSAYIEVMEPEITPTPTDTPEPTPTPEVSPTPDLQNTQEQKRAQTKADDYYGVIVEKSQYIESNNRAWEAGSHVLARDYSEPEQYFPEGNIMTSGGLNFSTKMSLFNLNDSDEQVKITVYFSDGTTANQTYTVNAFTKKVVDLADLATNKTFSIKVENVDTEENDIYAERMMTWMGKYGDITGVHSSTGYPYYQNL